MSWKILALVPAMLLQTACMTGSPQVEHYLTYTAKGTRSEARHGHLKIDGKEVPRAFSAIVFDGRAYSLRFRSQMWGDDGYHPDHSVTRPQQSTAVISAEAAEQGYYTGDERLSRTPEHWLFVRWKNQSAFVAPNRIEELIESLQIPTHPATMPLGVRLRQP